MTGETDFCTRRQPPRNRAKLGAIRSVALLKRDAGEGENTKEYAVHGQEVRKTQANRLF